MKRRLYQQVGVKEYWIVDPDEYAIKQLLLENGEYQEKTVASELISLAILPEIDVPVSELWLR